MLSKLWYLSQIIPPDNLHIEKIKKAIGKFLWSGCIYKIDRRQLCLSREKGGLALINVELKMKALYLKTNLFEKVDEIYTKRNDFLYLERDHLHLSRNTKEWYESAADVLAGNLITTKRIYDFFMEQVTFTNYIEIKCPNIPFTQILKNLNKNYIPCDWKSTTYLVINDVVWMDGWIKKGGATPDRSRTPARGCGNKQFQIAEAQDYTVEHCMR
jgi:hypothetical protein